MDWYFGRVKNGVKALFQRSPKLIPRSLVVGRHWLFLMCQPEPVYALFSKSLKRVNTLKVFSQTYIFRFRLWYLGIWYWQRVNFLTLLNHQNFFKTTISVNIQFTHFCFFLYFIKNIVSRRCFKPSFRVIIILIYHPRRGKLMLIALNFWCKP